MRFLLFTLSCAAAAQTIEIPAGSYLRGRTHKLEDDGLKWVPTVMKDDRPAKRIHVDAFSIDAHEVTVAEYAGFVKATGHRAPYNWPKSGAPADRGSYPVTGVSWDDAAAYAKWAGKRLPTEAEWERACRGGVEEKIYPWGDEKPSKERVRFDGVEGPGPVCALPKTGFGLCDIAGNVWEWTADWYERTYYERAPDANPPGPESGQYRVLRGGSWADEAKYLTCAYRSWARPAERSPNIGFRCAKSIR
jgi:formylglycine-generating enzyme required for sulfatase activity